MISNIVNKLYGVAFNENAAASDLLLLALSLGVLWAVFFAISGRILRPLVHGKPWLIKAGERDYNRNGKELFAKVGVKLTQDQFVEHYMMMWPWWVAVAIQHGIGGALCAPSILGLFDSNTASSLACLGILSEMGWEIQDLVSWILQRYASPNGKFFVPVAFLVICCVHHSLTTLLGIPIILSYRNFKVLHWICFNLQFAALTTVAITEYTKTLDVSIPKQLRQFRSLTFIGLMIVSWTRGVHWIYLCAMFLAEMMQNEASTVLTVLTACIVVGFSLFNWVFVIQPYYARFKKFCRVSAKHKTLLSENNATPQQRRASTIELQDAADQVVRFSQANILQEELLSAAVMYTSNEESHLSARRKTTPPNMMFGASKNTPLRKGRKNRRLSSIVMLRSLACDETVLSQSHNIRI